MSTNSISDPKEKESVRRSTPSADSLHLTLREGEGHTLCTVLGPLDFTWSPEFLRRLEPHCARPTRLLLDLSRTPSLDSAGIRALLELKRLQEEAGGTLGLIVAPETHPARAASGRALRILRAWRNPERDGEEVGMRGMRPSAPARNATSGAAGYCVPAPSFRHHTSPRCAPPSLLLQRFAFRTLWLILPIGLVDCHAGEQGVVRQ